MSTRSRLAALERALIPATPTGPRVRLLLPINHRAPWDEDLPDGTLWEYEAPSGRSRYILPGDPDHPGGDEPCSS